MDKCKIFTRNNVYPHLTGMGTRLSSRFGLFRPLDGVPLVSTGGGALLIPELLLILLMLEEAPELGTYRGIFSISRRLQRYSPRNTMTKKETALLIQKPHSTGNPS